MVAIPSTIPLSGPKLPSPAEPEFGYPPLSSQTLATLPCRATSWLPSHVEPQASCLLYRDTLCFDTTVYEAGSGSLSRYAYGHLPKLGAGPLARPGECRSCRFFYSLLSIGGGDLQRIERRRRGLELHGKWTTTAESGVVGCSVEFPQLSKGGYENTRCPLLFLFIP
jgi:hypothetical protein